MRFGNGKAIRNNVTKSPGTTPDLYDLATDPGEKTNLARRHPDLAAKAAAYMKAAHRPSREPKWNFSLIQPGLPRVKPERRGQ